jgi:predicted metal-dependent enzyme (double-stranded beta helix superfamily)
MDMSSESISRRSLIIGVAWIVAAQRSAAQSSSSGASTRNRFETDRFVDDVKRARAETDSQRAVEEVLQRAVSQPNSILAEIGEPKEAGIHPIHSDDNITILNVVWAPLMVLLPHNHNMWASIGIYTGREDNILWERRGDLVTATGAAALSEKEVFGLPVDAIHSVTNPIGRLTGAIHIYGGDFFASGRSEWDAESLRERPWDLDAARDGFAKAVDRFNAVP